MFVNTIDSKALYIDQNNNEIKDISNSIFSKNIEKGVIYSAYKINESMIMRPDLLSMSAYGTEEYTEMILKYSNIQNPFALNKNDIITVPSLNTIYNDVNDNILSANSTNETNNIISNYHKYIDNTKIPAIIGSEKNTIEANSNKQDSSIENIYGIGNKESNISYINANGISVVNGRIYFGSTISASTSNISDVVGNNDTSSNIVDCAKNGVTIGQFLNATIKNQI